MKANYEELFDGTIVEQGSNNDGTYIKYENGTMICYGKKTQTLAITSQSGQVYYNSIIFTFPEEFIEAPVAVPALTQTGGILFTSLGNNFPIATQVQVRVLSMVSNASANVTASYIAIGKWK